MQLLEVFPIQSIEEMASPEIQKRAVEALEKGKVLYFPALPFALSQEEQRFLTPTILDPKAKNISYDLRSDRLGGALTGGNFAPESQKELREMMKRYALTSRQLLTTLIPHYIPTLIEGKTSFRPVEIQGRKSSYRKDDTRLHVDAFPSNPTQGQRILRVFTNVNPEGKPRVWRLGEPFEAVVNTMAPRASHPFPGAALFLNMLGITKQRRTDYDHYMLQIHNAMKADTNYQKTVAQEEMPFPPGSTWVTFTDQTSHAALSGQHVMEQTFKLPVEGLKEPATSPLKVLERFFNRSLVTK
jgi:hypothetical protein